MTTKQTGIVKAELVPTLNQSELSATLAELQDELACVGEWTERAKAFVVTNAQQYKAAGEFRAQVRSQRKQPKFRLERFQEVAKQVSDFLRGKRSEAETQFDAIDALITAKMDDHARQERLAAEAEQRRINEERQRKANEEAARLRKEAEFAAEVERKKKEKEISDALKAGEIKKREAGQLKLNAEITERVAKENAARDAETAKQLQEVTVKPSLPTIAGSRRHVSYFADYTNFDALLFEFSQLNCALPTSSPSRIARRDFLRQFIMENQQALGKLVRDTQDSKKVEALLPGFVHAWDRDRT